MLKHDLNIIYNTMYYLYSIILVLMKIINNHIMKHFLIINLNDHDFMLL